jgi:uncharacterized protein (UPF0332 family)
MAMRQHATRGWDLGLPVPTVVTPEAGQILAGLPRTAVNRVVERLEAWLPTTPVKSVYGVCFIEPDDPDWQQAVLELVIDSSLSPRRMAKLQADVDVLRARFPQPTARNWPSISPLTWCETLCVASSSEFDPADFLAVARRLTRGHSEGDYRSAISRAYYAVFLRNREALTKSGTIATSNSGQDHGLVFRALRNRNRTLGREFDRLRRARTSADYDLMARPTREDAADFVRLAAWLMGRSRTA